MGHIFQQTIKRRVSTDGIGLHRGHPVRLTFHPSDEGSGLRLSIRGGKPFAMSWQHVVNTHMSTTLADYQDADVSVSTVEHVLAALAGCGIDNLFIELDGDEMPAVDGSAKPFVDMILRVGIVQQNAYRRFIRVIKPIRVEQARGFVEAKPNEKTCYRCSIDFDHPMIGCQHHRYEETTLAHFCDSLAAARTFGFLRDVKRLREAGLALGSRADNVIVLTDDAIVNSDGLRYKNEFVRHKLLDALGDFYLAGAPLQADIHCHCAGHTLHYDFLCALFADKDNWQDTDEAADSIIAARG